MFWNSINIPLFCCLEKRRKFCFKSPEKRKFWLREFLFQKILRERNWFSKTVSYFKSERAFWTKAFHQPFLLFSSLLFHLYIPPKIPLKLKLETPCLDFKAYSITVWVSWRKFGNKKIHHFLQKWFTIFSFILSLFLLSLNMWFSLLKMDGWATWCSFLIFFSCFFNYVI